MRHIISGRLSFSDQPQHLIDIKNSIISPAYRLKNQRPPKGSPPAQKRKRPPRERRALSSRDVRVNIHLLESEPPILSLFLILLPILSLIFVATFLAIICRCFLSLFFTL